MNLRRFYTNPEVKRITFKFIIILLLGTVSIFLLSLTIVKSINKILVNQNAIVLAETLENKQPKDLIRNFYTVKSKDELSKAKALLKSYGYDEELALESNDITYGFFKEILMAFIPIYIFFVVILYLLFMREMKNVFSQIQKIVKETNTMSDGKYVRIEGRFEEGEMAMLISSLNYMGDRVNNSIELLKEEREYLKDFLSDISHQLKTPLASLIMFNDLLRENENMPYDDRVNFLNKCEEQLGRMEWLIMNLLKVGRLEAGAINFRVENQSIEETINIAVSSLKATAKNRNQCLTIVGDLDSKIKHDREWLAEAISNIVKNAIEHTGENGEIIVKVDRGKLITKIYINDNGPGIPKDMQTKIFQRFYKGENSVNPKSIGIGLSLAKTIVEEQRGEIKLISEEGKGSSFIISFIN
ncbi:sensor histidine kinase [Inconstantimicrobium mannanitabidum]|uniref:Two-component sensor histidine kinase n=1 Tax=Inconstantimicrobium mannanitabidum TaxID=1604901 RepID=A0ACB5RD67_9CLOT|nr:HAMP domain-containing sensor histidine kinase [Clostridium sp. TW13]GKX67208.1 two-component sensor histidine kinase [Clostridium sp. TW13]